MRHKTGTAWAMASLFLLWHTQGLCQETEWEEFLQAEGRIFHGDYTFECEAKDEPPRRSDTGWACPKGMILVKTQERDGWGDPVSQTRCKHKGRSTHKGSHVLGRAEWQCEGRHLVGTFRIWHSTGHLAAEGRWADGRKVQKVWGPDGTRVDVAVDGFVARATGVGTPRRLPRKVLDIMRLPHNCDYWSGEDDYGSNGGWSEVPSWAALERAIAPGLDQIVEGGYLLKGLDMADGLNIEALSGVPVDRDVFGGVDKMTYFNPTFVDWVTDNLIPRPGQNRCTAARPDLSGEQQVDGAIEEEELSGAENYPCRDSSECESKALGAVCFKGFCVECRDSTHCEEGQVCVEDLCVECRNSTHCKDGEGCVDGSCEPERIYRARLVHHALRALNYKYDSSIPRRFARYYIALGRTGTFKRVRSLADAQDTCHNLARVGASASRYEDRLCEFWMRRTLDGTRRNFARGLAKILMWEGGKTDRALAKQLRGY